MTRVTVWERFGRIAEIVADGFEFGTDAKVMAKKIQRELDAIQKSIKAGRTE